jgi:DNA-binding response OmpR family regulator
MSDLPTIIIAERDPIFSSSLRVAFTELGFVVLLAFNGADAQDYAAHTRAMLVVVDASLPGITGYDACARIRRQPGYQSTPIVMTAHTLSDRMRAAAQTAGATTVLEKPYSFNDLLDGVAPFLAPSHPLLSHRPKPPAARETAWTRQTPLEWKFGTDSGLSRNKAVMQVVRVQGQRLPLKRTT